MNTFKNRRGRIVATALAGAMLIGSVAPAFSAVGIDINIAPPAPRIVEAPPPRARIRLGSWLLPLGWPPAHLGGRALDA